MTNVERMSAFGGSINNDIASTSLGVNLVTLDFLKWNERSEYHHSSFDIRHSSFLGGFYENRGGGCRRHGKPFWRHAG